MTVVELYNELNKLIQQGHGRDEVQLALENEIQPDTEDFSKLVGISVRDNDIICLVNYQL